MKAAWRAGDRGGPGKCPRQDSNLRTALRRRVLYPLSYGGVAALFEVGLWRREES